MQHCRFCQANLEPGAQRCSQCGQVQSASLTDTPMQPAAPTPFLSLATHSQDKLPDTPTQSVHMPDKGSETPDGKTQGTTAEQAGATPPLAAVAEPESHSPEEDATKAKTGEDKEGREEEEGPVATFRKRRIAFKTLPRPLQVLLLLTLMQIGVVGLLLQPRSCFNLRSVAA
jgi:hypothetical protein